MVRAANTLLALLLLGRAATTVSALTPFPLPQSMAAGAVAVDVSPRLAFACRPAVDGCNASPCQPGGVLEDAFSRYEKMLRPPATAAATAANALTTVNVCVSSSSSGSAAALAMGPATDESYTLTVSDTTGAASLTAASVPGVLHGLESLSHLVDMAAAAHTIANAPVSIQDAPRFPFRGLLVDTGRHFLPLSFLKRVVDGLHANKLNVLHWHITDVQSFPCGSDKFPELAAKGAFAPTAMYSPADMRALVAYAKARGVRIMPEWDVPGHGSWGKGKPDIMGCDVVLDPTQDATYDFLNAFFGEMMTIFEDEYVFLGGDEVDYTCWDANPRVAKWLKKHNMNSSQLQQYFWRQMAARVFPVSLANRTVQIWENDKLQIDPKDLPAGTVANVYQSLATSDQTVGTYGMPTVVSIAGDNWYLDSQCPGYNWNSWGCRYMVEPVTEVTRGSPLFLGGESAMWGEGINKRNFDAYVWHGAAAVAERLWSPRAKTNSTAAAQPRLAEHMCRLAMRGFNPGPISPGFCPADL